jgi:hypothetical protein
MATRRLQNPTVSVTEVLDKLSTYLSRSLTSRSIELNSNRNLSARVRSSLDQETVARALQSFTLASDWYAERSLTLEIPSGDHWYDFAVRGRDLFLPINLKVSQLGGADNVSAKDGLFYAITGIDPASARTNTWENFCAAVAQSISTVTTADYFFLVINKSDIGDVFWTSMKSLQRASPNGNNLPFQCDWSHNRHREYRTHDEAARYLLHILRRSFELRAEAFLSFRQHLDPILDEEAPS